MSGWIDIKKEQPPLGSRVLICDDNGYIDIEDVCIIHGVSWIDVWKNGNRTNIVAWMDLPEWPHSLINENADGELP